ncbi:hypothetical protein E1J61_02290 [Cupriavidus sp. L7L]|nr:hypothetical protein E1J61_02290 [Cupriavidus sp. L7L]
MQWLMIALGLALVAAALLPITVTWIEKRQARQVRDMAPYPPTAVQSGQTAVVYFSRSGNTALAARHVAQRLNAQLFELQATDYALGLGGWAHAMNDARKHVADITPRTIDLTQFDTVYLGSPVWLYSPAPPIWAFAENNRFDGKRVILFNTFNSHVGAEYIEAFRDTVMQRGARSFEHRHILRGRMTQQITPDEMLKAIDAEWFADESATSVKESAS